MHSHSSVNFTWVCTNHIDHYSRWKTNMHMVVDNNLPTPPPHPTSQKIYNLKFIRIWIYYTLSYRGVMRHKFCVNWHNTRYCIGLMLPQTQSQNSELKKFAKYKFSIMANPKLTRSSLPRIIIIPNMKWMWCKNWGQESTLPFPTKKSATIQILEFKEN